MGSLEEDQLWQMVHDFIEAEPAAPSHYHSVPKHSNSQATRLFSLQEILGEMTESEAQILGRIGIHLRNKMDMEKSTRLKRWLAMSLRRDGFDASLCHTTWLSSPGCPSGNYEYIDVLVGEGKRVLVDVDFRSQFEVARPTKFYTELSSQLPAIFVGGEEKLSQVVRVLCGAAEESMKERGLHVPPWRRAAYMHSKWLAGCTREVSNGAIKEKVRGDWDPPSEMMGGNGRGSGSALSSHFANLGINCC